MSNPYPIDFREPETADELAAYIGLDARLFNHLIASDNRGEFYTEHHIEKRSRHRRHKLRIVWDAKHTVFAQTHKALARRFEVFARLADHRFPHSAAYGYVKHRGTKDNSQIHCGAALLLRADIRDFFPSISRERLTKKFTELGMHRDPAVALAKFVTIEDRLPLGLNAGPMLANLVCLDLDNKLQELADRYKCRYTRYADDISISGNSELPSRTEIETILGEEGFGLSEEKFLITKIGQAHYVTGLSISDANTPHAPRCMKRKLRQELYYSIKYGTEGHLRYITKKPLYYIGEETIQKGINRLDGTYVSHIETAMSAKLKAEWDFLQARDKIETSYELLSNRLPLQIICYIDESEFEFDYQRFLALGLIFTDDPNGVAASTVSTLRAHHNADPFYAGNKKPLAKNGLHFTDSHPDLRTDYIKRLADLPFRAFVIYSKLDAPANYQETYLSLIRAILPKRLMWYAGSYVKIFFEQNSKVSTESLKSVVADVYTTLDKGKNRRPVTSPEVVIENKQGQPCFSVPDYMLAVFGRYAQLSDLNQNSKTFRESEPIRAHQFERLRDKYRLIVDADTGEEYSRRNSFKPLEIIKRELG